jgi:hypothetical protein
MRNSLEYRRPFDIFSEMELLNGILLKVVFVWFSTLIFPFDKILFMNRLKFSFFVDCLVRIFKTREEYGFL